MTEQLLPVLVFLLVVGIIWILLKFVLKFTVKIFSCGCVVILAIALILYAFGFIELPTF